MPMNPKCYPKDWKTLRAHVLARAEHRCECNGECGSDHIEFDEPTRCNALDRSLIQRRVGQLDQWVPAYALAQTPHHEAPVKVILTTAHTCQESSCNRPDHLLALCQLCHLRLDARQHAETRKKNREAKGAHV